MDKSGNDLIIGHQQMDLEIKTMLGQLETQLKFLGPSAFCVDTLLTLQDYKEQLRATGIITTPSIETRVQAIKEKLAQHNFVALVGETGTGKTQIARRIGIEQFDEVHSDNPNDPEKYLFLASHAGVTREDLLDTYGLVSKLTAPEDVPGLIQQVQDRYLKSIEGTNVSDQEKEVQLEKIENVLMGQSERPQMLTEKVKGLLSRAKAEGKILILDEFNYIPPGLLALLNSEMETKDAKKGFGIIFTGNMTLANTARYQDRRAPDAAFLNRLNGSLIQYNTPPLSDINSPLESTYLSEQQVLDKLAKGEDLPERELYQIALTHLIDKRGNLFAPEKALEQVWNMTQAFKIFQDNFAGGKIITVGNGRAEIRLQQTHASMRTLGDIFPSSAF